MRDGGGGGGVVQVAVCYIVDHPMKGTAITGVESHGKMSGGTLIRICFLASLKVETDDQKRLSLHSHLQNVREREKRKSFSLENPPHFS